MEQVCISHSRQVVTPPSENNAAFQEDKRVRARLRQTGAYHRFIYNASCASEILSEGEFGEEQRKEETKHEGEAYQRLLLDLKAKNEELKLQNCEIRDKTVAFEKSEAERNLRYRELIREPANCKDIDPETAKTFFS
uniref:AlNc14C78G5160 protein n=1 Tax=Albugo laibachii Nc14 TaxID=890382 RepID=F0WEW2_9STRA|nr:AlNc14C78G5160 [Albugo laibachii Nc14]|eukprot:CCA19744.1 AlNc14C78G5160 [Albugo laibachii Nc14]